MLKLLRNFDSDTFNHNPYLIEDEQLDVIDGRMKWCWQQMQERRQDVMDLLTKEGKINNKDNFNRNPHLIEEEEELAMIDERMKWCWQQMQEREGEI